jgi:hypothetical protein
MTFLKISNGVANNQRPARTAMPNNFTLPNGNVVYFTKHKNYTNAVYITASG